MTHPPFRHYHLLKMFDEYDPNKGPLDRWMALYFRANRALGSKDRAFISETAYALVRWQGLLDACTRSPVSWKQRFESYQKIVIPSLISDTSLSSHVRCSCPLSLFTLLEEAYGVERAMEIALHSNNPAPTTVRVNRIKTDRDTLLSSWKEQFSVYPCQHSPDGIVFEKKVNFYILPEFKKGLFSIQDEASQLVAQMIDPSPGDQVLDFCAGSGGKALAFAHKLCGKGQLYLHDVRERALAEAKQRLARAGIQNGQTLLPDAPLLRKLKKKCDWVLVDAPCSGTGTLRRNPDMKWRFSTEMLDRLIGQQRQIFEQALSYLKPNGTIVYATCSILPQENEAQVAHFVKSYDLEIEEAPFQSFPEPDSMDGFFACKLRKKR